MWLYLSYLAVVLLIIRRSAKYFWCHLVLNNYALNRSALRIPHRHDYCYYYKQHCDQNWNKLPMYCSVLRYIYKDPRAILELVTLFSHRRNADPEKARRVARSRFYFVVSAFSYCKRLSQLWSRWYAWTQNWPLFSDICFFLRHNIPLPCSLGFCCDRLRRKASKREWVN